MNSDDEIPVAEEVVELPFSELPPAEMPAVPEPEGLSDDPPVDEAAAATDVEEMLSAELLPEGLDLSSEASPPLPQLPTFQLHLRGLPAESKGAMKKALEAQGVAVPEQAWATGAPVVSQLSEYQVIALLQAARALGISADASVDLPERAPSEEELALGDLSAVPEPSPIQVESAPSVILPKGEIEVMIFTPDLVPGATVRESFGLVLAHRSIARRIFREEDMREKLQKELRAVPSGRNAVLPGSHLQILLRDLLLDLRKAALAKGANAVLGVKLEAFPESGVGDPQLEQIRLVAFGTAAVVDKS